MCRKAGAAFDGWTLIDAGGGVVVDLDDKGKEYYSERKVAALTRGGLGKVVGPGRYCPPRHPPHFRPSFLELPVVT